MKQSNNNVEKENYSEYNKILKDKTYILPFQNEYRVFRNYFKKNYLKLLPTSKNAKILDIGCGRGQFLYFLRKEGYTDIKGIDLDQENVNTCQKMGFKAVQKDLFEFLKMSNEKYDAIILNDVIEHIQKEQIVSALLLMKERLAPRGKLLIKTVNCNSHAGMVGFFSDFTHEIGFTEKSLMQVGTLSGFRKFIAKNLYIYPNIPILDWLIFCYFKMIYSIKPITNYVNGQKPFAVFSKNILAVFEK